MSTTETTKSKSYNKYSVFACTYTMNILTPCTKQASFTALYGRFHSFYQSNCWNSKNGKELPRIVRRAGGQPQ